MFFSERSNRLTWMFLLTKHTLKNISSQHTHTRCVKQIFPNVVVDLSHIKGIFGMDYPTLIDRTLIKTFIKFENYKHVVNHRTSLVDNHIIILLLL